ncbi:alpha-ketoglutarate-dependent dioxygenase AlkB [uncultured Pedobacter sp.]|uniref:alpha-ketoglutarate-dependent dioxygenase AlkB n=1 Tax=uncultured Pedobacter sp. TaxID=246139 RepID=UPI0025DD884C|nr:alpha-ketoglutarate-dependent dioxygenase AlkB [uncultured Pedobacter sp.]
MGTQIPGFFLYPDFISEAEEQQLLDEIDSQPWMVDYARRLQYYGFRNELEAPYALIGIPLPIPPIINELGRKIHALNNLEYVPDQVIINEYQPGEGIRPHKDRNYYENQICGINLASGCIMRFTNGKTHEVVDIELPKRSLYIMQDDARKKWHHGIPPRKKDLINGAILHRGRRVSITYRKVKPSKVQEINPQGRVADLLREQFKVMVAEK